MALLIELGIEFRKATCKATWYDKSGCSAKMYRYERERIADNPYTVCSSWYLEVSENALSRRARLRKQATSYCPMHTHALQSMGESRGQDEGNRSSRHEVKMPISFHFSHRAPIPTGTLGSPFISFMSRSSYSLPKARKCANRELKCGSERRCRIWG